MKNVAFFLYFLCTLKIEGVENSAQSDFDKSNLKWLNKFGWVSYVLDLVKFELEESEIGLPKFEFKVGQNPNYIYSYENGWNLSYRIIVSIEKL